MIPVLKLSRNDKIRDGKQISGFQKLWIVQGGEWVRLSWGALGRSPW